MIFATEMVVANLLAGPFREKWHDQTTSKLKNWYLTFQVIAVGAIVDMQPLS